MVAYASVSATSQLWGPTIAHAPAGKIALTFDDGPNGDTTLRLLDLLAQAQISATFFLIGRYVRQQPRIVQAIARAGHTLGNHTDSHPNLFFSSRTRQSEEISACQRSIEDLIGADVRFFRPPFGMRRPDTLSIAQEFGLAPVMWNTKCYDWQAICADSIQKYAERGIENSARKDRGALILLHDGSHFALSADRQATIDATHALITGHGSNSFVSLEHFGGQG